MPMACLGGMHQFKKVKMLSSTEKSAKSKTLLDDGKPKRPLSAYNFFFKEQRQQIISQGGTSGGFATLARTIAARWKTVKPEEQQECFKKAAEEKLRYQYEMIAWSARKEAKLACGNTQRPPAFPWKIVPSPAPADTQECSPRALSANSKPSAQLRSEDLSTAPVWNLSAGSSELLRQLFAEGNCTTRPPPVPAFDGRPVECTSSELLQKMQEQQTRESTLRSLLGANRDRSIETANQKLDLHHDPVSARSPMPAAILSAEGSDIHAGDAFSRGALKRVFDEVVLNFDELSNYRDGLDNETKELFDRMITYDPSENFNQK